MTDNHDEKDEEVKQPIIRKIKKHAHKHHGGSWKIAYADFVTAMMAFFLLMWLLASLNKAQKEGIADYFKQPLKVALISGESMGARDSTAKGGGDNIEKHDGMVSATDQPVNEKKQINKVQDPADKAQEMKQLEKLKSNIMLTISKDPALAGLKDQLIMDVVPEGLRVQLIDNQNRPMFDMGSDHIDADVKNILGKIAKLLNTMPNKITIQGHTDAHPFHNPEALEQTNWELSTQRANTARRALVEAGMVEDKVLRVAGYASSILLDKADPFNPVNRRISIIVMKKDAEKQLLGNETPSIPASSLVAPPIKGTSHIPKATLSSPKQSPTSVTPTPALPASPTPPAKSNSTTTD
ncbi:chemotaxis protein MotB [Legionella spiritensis]|nr:flagellar motor protein MotB [Legionella spiritensis]VEG90709.1 chemotaxis protein MotB [Legionella spiritensis]